MYEITTVPMKKKKGRGDEKMKIRERERREKSFRSVTYAKIEA